MRWYVHKNNDKLGPFSAIELREALRTGQFEPYDLVSLVSSPIRRPMVEVDEIFDAGGQDFGDPSTTSQGKYAAAGNDSSSASGDDDQDMTQARAMPTEAILPDWQSANSPFARGRLGINSSGSPGGPRAALITAVAADPSAPSSDYVEQKQYYLYDHRNRVMGPFTPMEIQSLFFRKLIGSQVRVQRGDSLRSISLEKFLMIYAKARRQDPKLNDLNQRRDGGLPSSRVLNEIALLAAARRSILGTQWPGTDISLVLSIIAICLAIFVAFIAIDEAKRSGPGFLRDSFSSEEAQYEQRSKGRRAAIVQLPKAPKPATPAPRQKLVRASPPRQPATPQKNATILKPSTTKKASPKGQNKNIAVTRAPRNQPPSIPTYTARTQRTPAPAARPPRPSPAPMAPLPVPTRTSVPAPRPGSTPSLQSVMGKTVTIGPLSYDSASLAGCPSRCTLRFFDAQGRTVRGRFFKDAFAAQLRSRSQGITIQGIVSNTSDGYLVLVQSIR